MCLIPNSFNVTYENFIKISNKIENEELVAEYIIKDMKIDEKDIGKESYEFEAKLFLLILIILISEQYSILFKIKFNIKSLKYKWVRMAILLNLKFLVQILLLKVLRILIQERNAMIIYKLKQIVQLLISKI